MQETRWTMKNPVIKQTELSIVFCLYWHIRKNARRDENMCTCNRTWQLICVAVPRTCCSSCMMTSTAMLRMPSFVCGLSDFKCVMHMRPNSLSASLISRIRILMGVWSRVEGKKGMCETRVRNGWGKLSKGVVLWSIGRKRQRQRERKRKKTDRREREREKREKQKKRVTTRSLTTTSNTLFQLSDDVDSLVKHRQLGLRLVNLEMHLTHAA